MIGSDLCIGDLKAEMWRQVQEPTVMVALGLGLGLTVVVFKLKA